MLKSVYDTDNDGIVGNSEAVGGLTAAQLLARANHTGTQTIATITGLQTILTDTERISLLGTNGHAPGPMVGGFIPAAQIPFSATQYKGTYNANTNSPTLTNGIGAAGDFYITTVAGAAGPAGALLVAGVIVYNGSVWQAGPSFSGAVTSVNGLSGIVSLTTATVPISTNKNYVTDAQSSAMKAGASSLNQFVLQSDLTTSFAPYVTPQQYGALNASSTFASLGITQPTIDATYPGIGAVTTDTVDWAACQYAINQSISQRKFLATSGKYYVNRGLTALPTDYKCMWKWQGNGATIITTNNNAFTVITIGMPVQQSGHATSYFNADVLVENTYKVGEIFMELGNAQKGFNFGPSYNSRFSQLVVTGGAIGGQAQFNLEAVFDSCNFRNNLVSLRLQSGVGLWTGATTSNSQCNQSKIKDSRVQWSADSIGADIGFDILDSSGVIIEGCVIEGSKVKKGINWYSLLTTVYDLTVTGSHYECSLGTAIAGSGEAFVYARTFGGQLIIDNAYGQYTAILADTGLSTGGAWMNVKIQNMQYWLENSGRALYNNGNSSYIFTNNDNPFKTNAAVIALTAGTAIALCGGDGCGNNRFYLNALPR